MMWKSEELERRLVALERRVRGGELGVRVSFATAALCLLGAAAAGGLGVMLVVLASGSAWAVAIVGCLFASLAVLAVLALWMRRSERRWRRKRQRHDVQLALPAFESRLPPAPLAQLAPLAPLAADGRGVVRDLQITRPLGGRGGQVTDTRWPPRRRRRRHAIEVRLPFAEVPLDRRVIWEARLD